MVASSYCEQATSLQVTSAGLVATFADPQLAVGSVMATRTVCPMSQTASVLVYSSTYK